MRKVIPCIVAALALGYQAAYAQPKPPQGAVIVASEPGKAAAVAAAEANVTVVAINAASRTLTLKGPKGRTLDVVCGDEVKNFAQIRVGDQVKVAYLEAISLEVKKIRAPLDASVSAEAARAAPGSKPAGAAGREIVLFADVVAVDPKKSTISLKGPAGNVMDLNVQNREQFKFVKKGDQVEAVYTQAIAVAVTPAPKAEAKKPASKAEAKK